MDRVRDRERTLRLDRRTGFLAVVCFFPAEVEWVDCEAEEAEDCAAIQGISRERDNTAARQLAALRADKIRGTTTFIFSL